MNQSGEKPISTPTDEIIAGNIYDKYHTPNPIARRLMGGFLRSVEQLTAASGTQTIHEVGCGEGHLALFLASLGYRVRASDRSTAMIQQASQNASRQELDVPFSTTNIYDLDPQHDAAGLVVCCEALEHLEHPKQALKQLASVASPYLLVSVPREPLWRLLNLLRGQYIADLGNTPGHLQHWSKHQFLTLLDQYVDILSVHSPLPWTVALCRQR